LTGKRIVVVGAGIGGMTAAIDLARQGIEVQVLERAATPGGKMREIDVGSGWVDAGPTVFTMRWVFESLFAEAGVDLADVLELETISVLARHAWRDGGRLDLHADIEHSVDAIAAFAGAREADGYRAFCRRSREIYQTLRTPYIAGQRPSPLELLQRVGVANFGAMWRTAPMRTLWSALGDYFHDPRLRQLFARYATYVGSSPFLAPATLMLIAHVEQDGVWIVKGGMRRVADALESLGKQHGASYRYGCHVKEILIRNRKVSAVRLANDEQIECDAVVFNGDISALANGLLGTAVKSATRATDVAARSLSAVTWCMQARASGFDLHHHNVFFAEDYAEEFNALFRRRNIVATPTVYVCAQDRACGAGDNAAPWQRQERLLVLINAPADGDSREFGIDGIARLAEQAFGLMRDCGLNLEAEKQQTVVTTPSDFERMFPATGGALYGRANHGSMASFARPGAASSVAGLYLAGGSVHPGPGIPMAALSGRLAAARLLADFAGKRSRA
jgi:1-hydroxycarotenoid 3,4-desaturase